LWSDAEALSIGKYTTRNPVARWLIRRFLDTVCRFVAEAAPKQALEVGCGGGFVLQHLRQALPWLTLDGLDLDQKALEHARRLNPGVRLFQGDLSGLGIRPGAYDLVLCLEVLEHLRDPERALLELRRIMRRSCLLSVPREPFFQLASLLRGKHLKSLGNHPGHLQRWSGKSFVNFCRHHLAVERVAYPFPWTLVLTSR